jgi:hypothetical protein
LTDAGRDVKCLEAEMVLFGLVFLTMAIVTTLYFT